MIEAIKDTAQQIAEDYLLTEKDMNEALLKLYQEGGIENLEVLKRICEIANQNVYLTLYQNEDTDKTNIKFDLVDFNKLKGEIQKGENAMEKYLTPPDDFRQLLTMAIGTPPEEMPSLPEGSEKTAELQKISRYKDSFEAFVSDIQSLYHHEMLNVERAFTKMASDAKIMITNGESLGDVAKIASRHVRNQGFDFMKVAAAYTVIHKQLEASNFKVKTEFTKISGYKFHENATMLKPVDEYIQSIEKAAALSDMLTNLESTMSAIKQFVTKEIKSQS